MSLSFEASAIATARRLLYEKALVYFNDQPVGTIAAIPQKTRVYKDGRYQTVVPETDLNYTELFIRDNVPTTLFFLLDGRADIARNFLDTCLLLQSKDIYTAGIFPASFHVGRDRLTPDYGQRAIGRVASVDATLWWLILAEIYVQRTGDRDWAKQDSVQHGIRQFLRLLLHPGFREAPTLQVPDGAFMIDRPLDVWGAPLEIQVLLYGALISSASLILAGHDYDLNPDDHWRVQQSLKRAIRLRRYLLKHYWLNTRIVQVLRRRPTDLYGDSSIINEYNIRTETIPHWLQHWLGEQGGYLIGNVRTGRPDFRFFTLGNCLGAIFDLLTRKQQKSLFELMLHNHQELFAEMPLRICHPPLDNEDWQNKTGFDPKNQTWCYHNSGHWPCLFWFLVIAMMRHQDYAADVPESYAYHRLLKDGYETLLQRLPEQQWAEYFDGPTGVWIGQQARTYQTWTLTSLLLSHHLLITHPGDRNLMNLPSLRQLLGYLRPN